MSEIILASIALVGGLIVIIISSDKAVIYTAHLARALNISPLIIGVLIVSVGTNLPEIFNSLISCGLGHGNISAGDSLGSILVLITLVFGLLPLLGGNFEVNRKEILTLGACELLSLIGIFFVIEKGYFTRMNALFLVISVILYFLLIYLMNRESFIENTSKFEIKEIEKSKTYYALMAILSLIGVSVSAFIVVESMILISYGLKINEFIISFLFLSIGTSLPELVVDVSALRRKEQKIAIGDLIGSCIINATLAIGIGQLFFPQVVYADFAILTILYSLLASIIIFFIIALRQKVDKKSGIIILSLYFCSYFLFFLI